MGQMRWRIQEYLFLEQLAATAEGHEYLEAGKDDWWKHATNWFVDRYRIRFPREPFHAETPEELAQRRKLQPRGQLTMHPAETLQAMEKRFTMLPSVRIIQCSLSHRPSLTDLFGLLASWDVRQEQESQPRSAGQETACTRSRRRTRFQ